MNSRFVAPKRLETLEDVRRSLQKVQEQLDALSPELRAQLLTSDVTLKAGEKVRLSPRQGQTLFAVLPKASQDNYGQRVTIYLESPNGSLRISAQRPDTIAGANTATFEDAGLIVLESNGCDTWQLINALPAESPGGGLALPIPDQRVLGNDSGAEAVATPITVHQELDWIGGTTQWIFDGVDDRASLADVLDFENTDPFSVSGWFSSGSLTAASGGRMISKADTSANQRGWFVAAAGVSGAQQVQFGLINIVASNRLRVQTTATYTNDTLHHFVITYDGSKLASGVHIYIDGVDQVLTTVDNNLTATTLSTAVLTLGNREDGARPFQGLLAHLAVWNSTLTPAQAAEVYNLGTPPILTGLTSAASLVGWWKLDDTDAVGAGGIVDHGSGLNNATAQSGLAPTGTTGALPVRGSMLWQLLSPGTSGLALVSNGAALLPSYRQIGTNGMPSYAADTFLGNFTGSTAVPAAVAGATVAGAGLTYTTGGILAVGSSTSIAVNANDIQRAALTGAVTAAVNSNTTAFGTAAAKSVLANATNAVAVPAFLAGSAAFQHLRVNSANAALEWATLSGYASTSITYTSDTFQRAALTGAIAAAANTNTTLFAGILDNASATTDRTNLNFVGFTITDDSVNDRIVITNKLSAGTVQRFTTAGTSNDVALNASTDTLEVDTGNSDWRITGFTGGVAGRRLFVRNSSNSSSTGGFLSATGSLAANQIFTPGNSERKGMRYSAVLEYDGVDSVWRIIAESPARPFYNEVGTNALGDQIQHNGTDWVSQAFIQLPGAGAVATGDIRKGGDLTIAVDNASSITLTAGSGVGETIQFNAAQEVFANLSAVGAIVRSNKGFETTDQLTSRTVAASSVAYGSHSGLTPTRAIWKDSSGNSWLNTHSTVTNIQSLSTRTNSVTVDTPLTYTIPASMPAGTAFEYYICVRVDRGATATASNLVVDWRTGGATRASQTIPIGTAASFSGQIIMYGMFTYMGAPSAATACSFTNDGMQTVANTTPTAIGQTPSITLTHATNATVVIDCQVSMSVAVASLSFTPVAGYIRRIS